MFPKHRALAALALFCLVATAPAQDVTPNWFRAPAISPDGSTLVFTHGGDLFRVSTDGGTATPLTMDDAWDGHPVWSPDGQWIAFASDRHGGSDVFVMPAAGGAATRLTYHEAPDVPSAFSADGQEIYFSSARMDAPENSEYPSGRMGELYAVRTSGGTPRQVLTTPAVNARPDRAGQRLVYEDVKGYENNLRKHHVSSVTRDLWLLDLASGAHTMLTTFGGEDLDPWFTADQQAMVYLSERNGDANVFRQALRADAVPEQLTNFEHHPVRDLSVARDGTLAFSWHGDLYTMAAGGAPQRVDVTLGVDRQDPPVTVETLRRGVSEFAVSPDGQEVAFVTRGEIFVTSTDFSRTKRITDTPEQERSVSFSPDGRSLLYAGERDGSWNVYVTRLGDDEDWFYASTVLTEEEIVATDEEEFQPAFSPDGEEVAYLAERTILKVKNLDSGRVRTVMAGDQSYSYSDGDQWFAWSPDGEWFSVQFMSRDRFYGDAVGLVKADGSQDPIDITNSGYEAYGPRFGMDGGMVYWLSTRFGERAHGSWGGETDVLAAFLDQATYDRFSQSKEDRQLAEGRESDKDEKGKKDDDEDDEEEEKDEPITIDWDGLENRTLRLTGNSADMGSFALTPDGQALVYLARFEKGYDLWIHDFVEKSTKLAEKLGADGAALEMLPDGKAVFVMADGKISKIGLKKGDDGYETGKKEGVSFEPSMNVRPDAERAYLFEHVWRQVKQKFYRQDLHGVDWDFYRAQYRPKLDGVSHNRDFAEVLSELLGELNASHTGSGYTGGGERDEPTASLGVFYDWSYDGDGLRIAEILPRGPLAAAELGIEPGTVITHVDGVALTDDVNFYALLNGKQGERIRLRLDPPRGDAFERVVEPYSRRQADQARYDRWVQQRRDLVEELSDGRVGYVHVQGMNDRSFRVAYSEIMGRNFEKEALVVDTRFNGGGWLHDDLIVLLSGETYVDFMPRNQAAEGMRIPGEPGKRWSKPNAVVMNEACYSDAHFFPWSYDHLDVGPTIGMPVAGTATAVWWERLHTGDLYFGIPQVGVLEVGSMNYLENQQLEPDHRMPITPEQHANGEDPQIAKAVRVMLEAID